MKVKELRLRQVISKNTYQAHLAEAIILQMIEDGKLVRITIEEIERRQNGKSTQVQSVDLLGGSKERETTKTGS